MLLNFTVGNWMSYRDEMTLSLTSSRERQHAETLAKLPGFRSKKALPITAVYGGNASGKTGLFKAIATLRSMVTTDLGVNGLLPLQPFLLESDAVNRPTVFDITFLAGNTIYRFVIEATLNGVSYESLEVVKELKTVDIYERDVQKQEPYTFNENFFSDTTHIEYVAKSTRANQLFLSKAVADNVAELVEAYSWFASTLELVGVGSDAWAFATAMENKEGFLEFASDTLAKLDTGISHLAGEKVYMDALPPDAELHRRISELVPGEVIAIVANRTDGDYGFEMLTARAGIEVGQPNIQRLRTLHRGPDGKEYPFGLGVESSGTQRLMVLLPMLFDLSGVGGQVGSKVYIVDELDRCLHTMLTRKLIEDFLATCNANTRKQILFTTHDLLLMDQSLLRRDEMYIAQRHVSGCSELVSLNEFEGIRFDKDLVRSYLDGRFGGIPMFGQDKVHG